MDRCRRGPESEPESFDRTETVSRASSDYLGADMIPAETNMKANRRIFLLNAAGAMAVHAASPADQVVLGVIGSGSRGTFVMTVFQKDPAVRIGAICDVYEPNLENAVSAA